MQSTLESKVHAVDVSEIQSVIAALVTRAPFDVVVQTVLRRIQHEWEPTDDELIEGGKVLNDLVAEAVDLCARAARGY